MKLLPFAVHLLVIVLVVAAGYFFHPRLVIQIPLNGLHDTVFELRSGYQPRAAVIFAGSMA